VKNKIIIISDKIQSGKTTFLLQAINNQTNVGGILTPIINDKRMFYDIATKNYFEIEAVKNERSLQVGKYFFSLEAFTKAQNILLEQSKNKNINYLIIDEIGPLEIKKEQGFFSMLKNLLNNSFAFTLILVVRQQLLEECVFKFNIQEPIVLSIENCINEQKILFTQNQLL